MKANELARELLVNCVQSAQVKIMLTGMEISDIQKALEDDTKPFIILEIRGIHEHYDSKNGQYDVALLVNVER